MIKKILVLMPLLIIGLGLHAQKSMNNNNTLPKIASLKGLVIDASTKMPVEYANIVLYSHKDSSMITGTITKQDGTFKLENLPFGRFYISANFIGYEKKTITGISINNEKHDIDLGTITLNQALQQLDAVEIVAERQPVEYMIDKKVINVNKDLIAANGTAIDVLENAPSVQTDIDGNITLRGSSSFTVLIDGRPSALEGSEALQQIPASSIENIEIITNPSAKYDPEGVSGIINVVLKKDSKGGLTGMFNITAGLKDKYKGDFILNYRKQKYNVFLSGEYNDFYDYGSAEAYSRRGYTDYYYQEIEGDRNMHRFGYNVKSGFEYVLNKMNVVSISGTIGKRGFGMEGFSNIHEYDDSVNLYSYSESKSEHGGDYFGGNLFYEHKFNEDGHKISGYFDYTKNLMLDEDKRTEYATNSSYERTDPQPYKQNNEEDGYRQRLEYKVDYEFPLNKNNKIEAGLQGSSVDIDGEYTYNMFDYTGNTWISMDSLNNDLRVNYDVQGIYGIYSGTLKKFSYQAGVRSEYMLRTIEQQKTNAEYELDGLDVFPTIHLSYKLTDRIQLQSSYTKRVNRPRGWFLNPFPTYMDDKNLRVGNPELKPEYIDSYELNFIQRFGEAYYSIETYYRQTNDKIERFQKLQNENEVVYTFGNLERDHSIGVELTFNFSPYKFWNINVGGNYFNYRIEGAEVSDDNSTTTTNTYDIRLNNTIKLKTATRFQLMGYYTGPSITSQGTTEEFLMTSFAASQEFMKRKMTLTLQFRDLFGTMKHKFTTDTEGLYSTNEFAHESPVVTLGLTYRLNNYKNNKKERNGEEIEFDSEGGMY